MEEPEKVDPTFEDNHFYTYVQLLEQVKSGKIYKKDCIGISRIKLDELERLSLIEPDKKQQVPPDQIG